MAVIVSNYLRPVAVVTIEHLGSDLGIDCAAVARHNRVFRLH